MTEEIVRQRAREMADLYARSPEVAKTPPYARSAKALAVVIAAAHHLACARGLAEEARAEHLAAHGGLSVAGCEECAYYDAAVYYVSTGRHLVDDLPAARVSG